MVDNCYLSACNEKTLDSTLPATKDAIRSLDLYCDVSQNASSCRWSTGHIQGLTASSNIYSFQLDRLLMPEEMMMAYGWPRRTAEARTRDPEVMMPDLAGHTIALQPLATVILAIIMAAFSSEGRQAAKRPRHQGEPLSQNSASDGRSSLAGNKGCCEQLSAA